MRYEVMKGRERTYISKRWLLCLSVRSKDIRVKKIEFCHNVLAKSFQRLGDLFVSFITGPLACNRIKKRHIRW